MKFIPIHYLPRILESAKTNTIKVKGANTMRNNEPFERAGNYLRELRKEKHLSIFKVARAIDISGNYLSVLERGKQQPSNTVLYKIAEFYDKDVAEIFGLYDRVAPEQVKEMLAIPSFKTLLTQMSKDRKLSLSQREDLERCLYELKDYLLPPHEDSDKES